MADTRVHDLKCWPSYFRALCDGTKNFELRNDDRGYRVDDYLSIRLWDPGTQKYGRLRKNFRVTYRTPEHCPFLPRGIVALALRPADWREEREIDHALAAEAEKGEPSCE